MAYENSKPSKICPLCENFVKREDLRHVSVRFCEDAKLKVEVPMHLMVRNKANMVIKDKFYSEDEILPLQNFPQANEKQFK